MTQFEQRMEVLRARFIARCRTEVSELRGAFQQDDLTTLRRIGHSLAGNAGLFGFPRLSVRARELEDAIDRARSAEDVRANLDAVIAEMPDEPDRGPNVLEP
ncbi:Hpt domain-containing protein [Croceibacterium sp. LX-88]|uniref:Hpt domain-containing protein n=1 Tax=Croceibacterium selenioxidans TaxID=2838833 RepID=A0ABS5VZS8_9SPHN|nr:Hpt domain-containing protein [Croceibacterium selenioxidans]